MGLNEVYIMCVCESVVPKLTILQHEFLLQTSRQIIIKIMTTTVGKKAADAINMG